MINSLKKILCPIGTTSDGPAFPGNPGDKDVADCYQCPKGYYCVRGEEKKPCPKGTYMPEFGASALGDCKECEAGYYCKFSASSSVTGKCPAGTYCPTQSIEPRPCFEGKYCSEGSGQPIDCPGGYYCTESTKEPCRAGTYCPIGTMGRENQIECPKNSYCPEQSVKNIQCPGGGATETTGASREDQCFGAIVTTKISKAGLAFAILIPLLLVLLLIYCICRRYRQKKNDKKKYQSQRQSRHEVGYPENQYVQSRNAGLKNVAFTSTTTMSSDNLPSNVERRFEQMSTQQKVYNQQFRQWF